MAVAPTLSGALAEEKANDLVDAKQQEMEHVFGWLGDQADLQHIPWFLKLELENRLEATADDNRSG